MHTWVGYTCSKEFRREPRNVPLGSRNNEATSLSAPRPMHHRSCATGVRFFTSRLIYTFLRTSSFFAARERKTEKYTSFCAYGCPFASRKNITSVQRENISRISSPIWTKTLVKQLCKNYYLFLLWKNFPIRFCFYQS